MEEFKQLSGVVEIITPEVARLYLEKNTKNNRKITSAEYVNSIARDMANGKWRLNGEPIVFDELGVLKDGQHRLKAVIKSGCSVPMLVVRGVDSEISIFDKGKSRSVGDTLSMSGIEIKNRKLTLTVVRMALNAEDGLYKPTDDEVINKYISEKEYYDKTSSIAVSTTGYSRKAPVAYGFYRSLKLGVSENVLIDFKTVLNSGFYDYEYQTPAVVLRNMIIPNPNEYSSKSGKNVLSYVEQALHDFEYHKPRKLQYKQTELKYCFKEVK